MHRAPRLVVFLVALFALPALAFAAEPATEGLEVPAPAAVEAPEAQPFACEQERAADDVLKIIAPTVFDTLEANGFDPVNCNKPGDCPYGGYCYLDCSPCSTWRDCPFGTCTSIRLC